MYKPVIALFIWSLSWGCAADVLDDALEIVLANSPTIAGKRGLVDIEKRKHIWDSKVTLGARYAQKQTSETASGLDGQGRIEFSIPLFDDGGKGKSIAEEKANVAAESHRVAKEFFDAVRDLQLFDGKVSVAEFDVGTAYDELRYFKAASDAAVFDSAGLWTYVKAAKDAEKAEFSAKLEYKTKLRNTARLYGGTQRTELEALINQHVASQRTSIETKASAGNEN